MRRLVITILAIITRYFAVGQALDSYDDLYYEGFTDIILGRPQNVMI